MPSLYLIDGFALAYRAYFSFIKNPLRNKNGMETSAIYGFTTSVLRLLEKEKPDYIAAVFDSPEPTFRHEKFPEYKATREKMPEEMADQLPYLRNVIDAMRIPYIAMPTFEADDIMGTLAVRALKKGIDTYLVSGDKDFLQLLQKGLYLYTTKKGGIVEIHGPEGPEKKWGVPAHHVVDLLALMGDASDNIPGVPGIGEKTAAKLILAHGSVEDIYKKLDEVAPPRIAEKLRENEDLARLCKELVTIHRDVPVKVDVDELKRGEFNVSRLLELYDELDFHSLYENLRKKNAAKKEKKTESKRKTEAKAEPMAEAETETKENSKYKLVRTEEDLRNLAKTLKASDLFSFDTETTSLHPLKAEAVGFSFATKSGEAYYVPFNSQLRPAIILEHLKPILEDPKIAKGGQNAKYDRHVLKNLGIDLQGLAFDSMLESYVLDPGGQHGLNALAIKYLDHQNVHIEELIGKGQKQISMLDVDLEKVSHYACEDADITFQLHRKLAPRVKRENLEKLYRDVELPLLEVLGDMERNGIALDVPFLEKLSKSMAKRSEKLEKKIYELAGEEFNLKSPKQLGPILFEKLQIQKEFNVKRVKKTKTGYSTDHNTLEQYKQHPLVESLLEFRNLTKLRSTYTEALPQLVHPRTKRVHTSFNQSVTATGRLSSSDPNLQNIPIRSELGREIRKAFVPGEKGWKLISADYSQVELRILAHMANDPVMIETFKKDEDVHNRTAAVIFGKDPNEISPELRNRAKTINFGILYGMGPQRLSRETGITLQEAKDFIEEYFTKFSTIRKFIDKTLEGARKNGYVTTLLGRKRWLPDIESGNPRFVANSERIAINTPIQGSAADLIKLAMIQIQKELTEREMKTRMLLQVHDELVFEAPEEEVEAATKLIVKEMEGAMDLKVPLKVEVGTGSNWAEAH